MMKINSKVKFYLPIVLAFMFLVCFSNVSFASYSSVYNEPTSLIRMGSNGTGVKWVQDMLNKYRI